MVETREVDELLPAAASSSRAEIGTIHGVEPRETRRANLVGGPTFVKSASVVKRAVIGRSDRARILYESLVDGCRHLRYSAFRDVASNRHNSSRNLECQITKDYHRIEKGLSLRSPRRDFGEDVARRLRRDIVKHEVLMGPTPVTMHARDALQALDAWRSGTPGESVVTKRRLAATSVSEEQLDALFRSRSSVRQFSRRAVPPALLTRATELAACSPSVCNREAWSVHAYLDRADIERLLALQNGNRGFNHEVPCLLVVGVDARLFAGAGERNQRWIDGGLFAMSLGWALHGLGLSTCFLNWSVTNAQSRRLRAAMTVPPHVDIITMIAVGYSDDDVRVARSPRRNPADILTVVRPHREVSASTQMRDVDPHGDPQ